MGLDDLLDDSPFTGRRCTIAQTLDLLDDAERNLLARALEHPRASAGKIAAWINEHIDAASVSALTVRRHINRHTDHANRCKCP